MARVVQDKSFEFALEIIKVCEELNKKHKYELSKQLLRSGTSVGANIAEADYAQSDADRLLKLSIALKEASESRYWLKLLTEAAYLNDSKRLISQADEIIKLLVTSTKTIRSKLG